MNSFIRSILVLSIISLFSFSVLAQDTASDTSNNGQTGKANQGNVWDSTQIEKFVKDAANGSMFTVQMGNVAGQKAQSPQVRDFATMMVSEHGNASQTLMAAVKGLGIDLPTSLDKKYQDKIEKISKKDTSEFDKEYMKQMVKEHQDDIKKFEKAEKNLPAGALKTWVSTTLPVLRQHLSKAEEIEKNLDVRK